MNILIVEDELHAAKRLLGMLKKVENVCILDVCTSVKETLSWLEANDPPDLLFLDIQLSDGISFEIFEKTTLLSPIIFVTAFNHYAIEAFKLNSIDYILKPYLQADIEKALDKYRKIYPVKNFSIEKEVIEALKKSFFPNYKSRFFVKLNHTVYSIAADDILFFQFEDQATVLRSKEGKSYVINYSLENLEKQLDPKKFFRINRKTIIHMESIKKMEVLSQNRIDITLLNHQKEIVSRAKTKDFKIWLDF
ncbi:MAG: LytTR family DNA-binding domain-containing protein [Flavobacteriaceae bacterium]|nr:response regulator transcription factor [Flavobacteriaceae bacterium]